MALIVIQSMMLLGQLRTPSNRNFSSRKTKQIFEYCMYDSIQVAAPRDLAALLVLQCPSAKARTTEGRQCDLQLGFSQIVIGLSDLALSAPAC